MGYADIAENQNLVVANDSSYTSLSFEEISMYGRLIHLDLNCTPYEDCINCCSFNESSSLVAVSVGKDSVYLWDVQTHTDIQHIITKAPIRQLQRFVQSNSWLGCMDQLLFVLDDSQESMISFIQSPVSCFGVSPDKQYLSCCVYYID